MATKGIVINISGSGEGAVEALRQIEAKMQETAVKGKEAGESLAKSMREFQEGIMLLRDTYLLDRAYESIKGMIEKSMELGVELNHLSQQTGITVENLSALKFASEESGVSFETLTKGFKKLSTTIFELHEGSKLATDAFAALGISEKQIDEAGNDMYKVMALVADKFREMPDGIQKNALATQLFGRAGQELIPILNQGAQAIDDIKKRAPIFTEEDIQKMEEMHKATADLSAAWERMSLTLSSKAAPALSAWFKLIASGESPYQTFSKYVANEVVALGQLTRLVSSTKLDLKAPSAPGVPFAADSPAAPKPAGTGPTDGITALDRAFWLSNPRSVLEAYRENQREITAAALQTQQDAIEAARKQLYPDVAPLPDAIKAKLPPVSLDNEVPGGQSPIKGSQLGSEAAQASAKTITGFMDRLSEQAIQGRVNFRSLVDGVVSDLERFAMKVVEERTLLPLLNSLFGGLGSGGGFNDAGYSTAALGSDGQGLFAGGGDIDHGWAVVGDGGDGSGSELFAPKGPGTILPHDVLQGLANAKSGGGGGSPSVTINNINNSSSQVQMKQGGVSYDAQAKQFVIHTVLEDMNQGGPLSSAMSGFAPK